MKTVLTAKISKENENYTILNRNISQEELIRLAANAVLETLKTEGYDLSTPCILCGGGNNGGDGILAAIIAKNDGCDSAVLFLGDENNCSTECKRRLCEAKELGVPFVNEFFPVVDVQNKKIIIKPIEGLLS